MFNGLLALLFPLFYVIHKFLTARMSPSFHFGYLEVSSSCLITSSHNTFTQFCHEFIKSSQRAKKAQLSLVRLFLDTHTRETRRGCQNNIQCILLNDLGIS